MTATVDPYLWVAAVIFLGVFTQSLSGFGVALVTMALLPLWIGIETAAPLVALVALSLEAVLLLVYRRSLDIRAVRPLVLAALVGIPLGIWGLSQVDEGLVLGILGVVISGYALYSWLGLSLPRLANPAWAYGAGFIAGVLGGAYNTSGPPVVMYSDTQGWDKVTFKTNLQGFFLAIDLFVVLGHAFSGNITADVGKYYLLSLPVLALGILTGIRLERYPNPVTFRRIVLVILVVLGLRLVFS